MQNNIKATELRIGNLVKFQGEIIEIDGIDKFNIYWGNGNFAPITINGFFRPIPLTEEWLKKFGIEYEKDIDYFFISFELADGDIELISNTDELGTYWFSHQISTLKIRYCHQLQNLYFCLSGEELTIKENE
jgi:hypothetical protein